MLIPEEKHLSYFSPNITSQVFFTSQNYQMIISCHDCSMLPAQLPLNTHTHVQTCTANNMCLVCMTHGVPLQVSFPRPVSLYENCSIADETPAPPAGENQRYPSPVSSLSLKYNYDFYASMIQRKLYFTLTWLLKIK